MPGSEVAEAPERRDAKVASGRHRPLLAIVVCIGLAVGLFLLSRAGAFLILHAPERSDVIVVLNGAWPQGVRLQTEGYAPEILLDAAVNHTVFGRSEADLASEFLASRKPADMQLCRVSGDSIFEEPAGVQRCLEPLHVRSVLLVASDFDTRRTLETFRARLPQYRWSIAASSAPYHDADQYWKHRAWAKTVFIAWEQYLYWKLVDQRRSDLVLR